MLTVKQVAERLSVSEKTVLNLIKDKHLNAYQFGKRFRVDENDLKEYIKNSQTIKQEVVKNE